MVSPNNEGRKGFLLPYHQTITQNHVSAIDGFVGEVQRDGLAIEVVHRTLGIEETCLERTGTIKIRQGPVGLQHTRSETHRMVPA